MTTTPVLARITVFPIKALDGVELDSAQVLPSGAIAGDREFALVDAEGGFLNVKRSAELCRVRARYALADRRVSLSVAGFDDEEHFNLDLDRDALGEWFAQLLGAEVRLVRDVESGFPDDTLRPGPTVVSRASLAEAASWFEGVGAQAMGRRIRANLELAECEAFWEDRLFGPSGAPVLFSLGEVDFLGEKPCVRCTVPARDPQTGASLPGFQARFEAGRRATLPSWAEPSCFETFYALAVNTRVRGAGGALRRGDPLTISVSGISRAADGTSHA